MARARARKPPGTLSLENRWLSSLEILNARTEWHSLRALAMADAGDVKVSIGNCPRCLRKSAERRALSEKGARKHKQVLRSMSGLVHVTNVGYLQFIARPDLLAKRTPGMPLSAAAAQIACSDEV